MRLEEMTKWPRTPSRARLRRAIRRNQQFHGSGVRLLVVDHNELSPSEREEMLVDMPLLPILLDEHTWQEWAVRAFEEQRTGNPEEDFSLMSSITRDGDTEDTIGLATSTRGHPDAATVQIAVGFSRLIRHNDWMGLCALLPNVKELCAIVVESRKEPGRIGHAICVPGDYAESGEDEEIPIPEGRNLVRLLKWHGVGRILWNPVA